MQWQMAEQTVLRLNFAQTIARQTFRELTPIIQEEYAGGPIFIGNPELQMSSLDNYDLRLDLTPGEGWFISVSGFYKSVADAIEYAQFEAPQGFVEAHGFVEENGRTQMPTGRHPGTVLGIEQV